MTNRFIATNNCRSTSMTLTQRYLLYISYMGSGFRGSQIQINSAGKDIYETVQGNLIKSFNSLPLSLPKVKNLILSSRTDTGVHALRAGCHFDLPPFKGKFIQPQRLRNILNNYFLKNSIDIRILDGLHVSDNFHARYSALEKVYVYRVGILKDSISLGNKIQPPPSEIRRTYFYRNFRCSFDPERVKNATKLFLGEKDFGSFMYKFGNHTRNTICCINSLKFEPTNAFMPNLDHFTCKYDYYHFVLTGNRFLHKMVRKIVSTLMEVGYNRISENDIKHMFHEPSSSWLSHLLLLPGYGLYLANITFKPEHLTISEDEKVTKQKLLQEMKLKFYGEDFSMNKVPFSGFKNFVSKMNNYNI